MGGHGSVRVKAVLLIPGVGPTRDSWVTFSTDRLQTMAFARWEACALRAPKDTRRPMERQWFT